MNHNITILKMNILRTPNPKYAVIMCLSLYQHYGGIGVSRLLGKCIYVPFDSEVLSGTYVVVMASTDHYETYIGTKGFLIGF